MATGRPLPRKQPSKAAKPLQPMKNETVKQMAASAGRKKTIIKNAASNVMDAAYKKADMNPAAKAKRPKGGPGMAASKKK